MQTNENKPGSAAEMKHPRADEWMGWLYDEISRAEKARLAAHLAECGQCRADVKRWERAKLTLDFGKVQATPVRARLPLPLPWLKWGIAAALMLAIGFSAGRRVTPPEMDVRALRASLKAELHAELYAQLEKQQSQQLTEYKTNAEQKTAQDNKLVLNALGKLETDRIADYASLHKELETVAVLTQNSLQQAQQQIVTLANYSQPNNNPSSQ